VSRIAARWVAAAGRDCRTAWADSLDRFGADPVPDESACATPAPLTSAAPRPRATRRPLRHTISRPYSPRPNRVTAV